MENKIIKTNFESLDDLLNGGLVPGNVVIVSSSSAGGKTSFLTKLANNIYLNDYNILQLFDNESISDLTRKHCSILSNIPQSQLSFNDVQAKNNIESITKNKNNSIILKRNFGDGFNLKKLKQTILGIQNNKNIKFDVVTIDILGLNKKNYLELCKLALELNLALILTQQMCILVNENSKYENYNLNLENIALSLILDRKNNSVIINKSTKYGVNKITFNNCEFNFDELKFKIE